VNDKTDAPDASSLPAEGPGATDIGTLAPPPHQPQSRPYGTFNWFWVPVALLVVAAAVAVCVVVGGATAFSHADRAAAAGGALLVVVALAVSAQVILLCYQYRIAAETGAPTPSTLSYRRRGLKAAVIGQDGRASTSKTGVVLWTGAVVWALVNLLLLARAYPGGNLFTTALTTDWRPEYLILLGLPVAAATTAKAAVASSNQGQGPLSSQQAQTGTGRIYVRDPVPDGVQGFVAGMAELITADDGTVAWADLQYVAFTLITLVYFATQVLAQPQNGLPQIPPGLLTLMGVSSAAYAANKIVSTKGSVAA
jgi:hypothetical protein